MTSFRLARILRLRERQARVAQLAWAAKERAAVEAATRRDDVRRAIEAGYAATRAMHGAGSPGDPHGGASAATVAPSARAAATLLAYDRVDALHGRAHDEAAALLEARLAAQEARAPYDEKRRAVEALRRLEENWKRERRRSQRRKEGRTLDAAATDKAVRDTTSADPSTLKKIR